MDRTNKNPGAAATASGVKQISPVRNLAQCIRIARASQPDTPVIQMIRPQVQPHHCLPVYEVLSPAASNSREARHD